ncbi:hypothetical protein [Thalassobellus sediminis]|uniref:hypothetical protein n=1 Tax=Thalassobellus sediminis TaxID=3367753 RepID=UPI00378FB95A
MKTQFLLILITLFVFITPYKKLHAAPKKNEVKLDYSIKEYISPEVKIIQNKDSLKETNKPNKTETKFSNWLKKHVPGNYKNTTYDHHNDWYQVYIPEYELTLSWGPVTSTQTELKEVEGLSENESLFIAKQTKENWDNLLGVKYFPGIGYYVSKYSSSTMGHFKVRPVSIIQFSDNDAKKFVNNMVNTYDKKLYKSEEGFSIWVKEYINTEHPKLIIDYHGAWYQSVIPKIDLTVTWGTMDKSQMQLKDLHGVREDNNKSFFIEKKASEGWEKLPNVHFTKGVGYFISKYNASSMSNFEVGSICVIQFNGDAKAFVNKMTKAWKDYQ